MAGPWFTVRKSRDGFQEFGDLWLSNGETDDRATIEYRVRFAPVPDDVAPLYDPLADRPLSALLSDVPPAPPMYHPH